MLYQKFNNTDLTTSVLGLGTWVMGADSWGFSLEKESLEAIQAALDQGINFIDTAPIYGNGRAETILGKAIRGKREKVILATKCGIITREKKVVINLSAGSIKKELEESLKRLQVDYIDLYQCHWPDPSTPIEWTMEVLNQLKKEGKIRHIGVCNFPLPLFQEASEFSDIVSLQSQYSLLERFLEKEIIPGCLQKGAGIIAYGVLGGGILTGKYKLKPRFPSNDARSFFYKFYRDGQFEKIERIIKLLEAYPHDLNQTAINWVRQREAVAVTLIGCRNARQVIANAKAVDWQLSAEEIEKIDQIRI